MSSRSAEACRQHALARARLTRLSSAVVLADAQAVAELEIVSGTGATGRDAETRAVCQCGSIRPMHVFLETERLVLRRFTENDADLLVELDSDPEVMYFITGGRQTPRREIEIEVLPAYLEYYERYAGFGFWAAIERSSGEFVGWFHFRPESEHDPDQVELGYRLRRSVWGMGYATEGSRALIEKGFVELGVERVFATAMVVNVASRRVMEKAGLRYVRTFHQPWPYPIEGDEHGDVEYALLRAEWESD